MIKLRLISIFFLLFFLNPIDAFSNSLKVCYDVKVFFLKVGESCISYSMEGSELKISSYMKTVNIGSIAKRIYDHGGAEVLLPTLKPKLFFFYQEEGSFKRYQEYNFKNNSIFVKETKYKKLTDIIEKDENKTYSHNGELDPYSAGLYLFLSVPKHQKGTIPIFYDDRFYKIPWERIEKTVIFSDLGNFNAYKIKILPNIKGKGLLQPKGEWFLWIDEKTKLPIEMEVGFIIGSVKVKATSINGDYNLFNKF